MVELSLFPMKRMMVVALLSTTSRALLSTILVATATEFPIESDSASRLRSSYLHKTSLQFTVHSAQTHAHAGHDCSFAGAGSADKRNDR